VSHGSALPIVAAALLSACAPGDTDTSGGVPGGYELAAARSERSASATQTMVADMSPADLRILIDKGGVRLIDVRTDTEVADGAIPGADHVPLDKLAPASLNTPDGVRTVFYCRSGRRSRIAAERFAEHTGEATAHLAGGILAWEAAGGPVRSN